MDTGIYVGCEKRIDGRTIRLEIDLKARACFVTFEPDDWDVRGLLHGDEWGAWNHRRVLDAATEFERRNPFGKARSDA